MEISPSVRDFRFRVARFVELTLFRLGALLLPGDISALLSTALPVMIALKAIVRVWSVCEIYSAQILRRSDAGADGWRRVPGFLIAAPNYSTWIVVSHSPLFSKAAIPFGLPCSFASYRRIAGRFRRMEGLLRKEMYLKWRSVAGLARRLMNPPERSEVGCPATEAGPEVLGRDFLI